MDKCLYNGKIIYAVDVAKAGIDHETEIRKSHMLKCCDPECDGELIYRGGPIKVAHFAHKAGNLNCCYNEYSSKMTGTLKSIRDSLFDRLKDLENKVGCSIDYDCRLSKDYRHITPISVCGRFSFAIDIMRCNKTANELDRMRLEYGRVRYIPLPVIIEDISENFNSKLDTYYTLRYWLNYSKNKTVLIFNQNNERYYLCRLDEDKYLFENNDVSLISDLDVFVHEIRLSDLNITEKGYEVCGFNELFSKWQDAKREDLRRYISRLETQRRMAAEREAKRKRWQESVFVTSHAKTEIESAEEVIRKHTEARADYEERIYPLMKELSKELEIDVTDSEFEAYFKKDYNSKSKILYKTYPNREQLKRRMKAQILNARNKIK